VNSSYPFAVAFLFLADGGDNQTAAIVGTVFAFLTLFVTRFYDARKDERQRQAEREERAAHLETLRADIAGVTAAAAEEQHPKS
jgi:hypothetical protein